MVLEVARVKPGKRRRWGFLAQSNPALMKRLMEEGLLPEYAFPAWQAATGQADASAEDDEDAEGGARTEERSRHAPGHLANRRSDRPGLEDRDGLLS